MNYHVTSPSFPSLPSIPLTLRLETRRSVGKRDRRGRTVMGPCPRFARGKLIIYLFEVGFTSKNHHLASWLDVYLPVHTCVLNSLNHCLSNSFMEFPQYRLLLTVPLSFLSHSPG